MSRPLDASQQDAVPSSSPSVIAERREARDAGISLLELLVVMLIVGILGGISVTGFLATQKTLAARGAHREVASELRSVQARAVQENRPWCVDFAASGTTTWRSYRLTSSQVAPIMPAGFACTSGTAIDSFQAPKGVRIGSAAFLQRNGETSRFVVFYPRGAASPGSIGISASTANAYTITVDGLTSRVDSTGN